MKRDQLITLLRIAGVHGDAGELVRLRIENIGRMTFAKMRAAYLEGANATAAGFVCNCHSCTLAAAREAAR